MPNNYETREARSTQMMLGV